MILVQDPYFNEPAHEATRGTDTGRSSAAAYNAELTLNVRGAGWTGAGAKRCCGCNTGALTLNRHY